MSPATATRPQAPLSLPPETEPFGVRHRIGAVVGPLAFLLLLFLPAPEGMSLPAWRTAAVGVLMAVWWITEALPIPATSLLPLALFPLLGIAEVQAAAAPYADPNIFLYMGGFMLALAMQRWNLHRRIALSVIHLMGTRPVNLVGGFMVATALISMWVSNTATAMMMLPIGLSVLQLLREKEEVGSEQNFEVALMLGIAYAASIGGFATLIGTPPNALFAGFMRQTYDVEVGFFQWMLLGVPVAIVVLPLCWLMLVKLAFPIRLREIPGGNELIQREYRALGRVTGPERWLIAVFALTGLAWMFRPVLEDWVPGLSDAGIAMTAGLILFMIPVRFREGEFLMSWEWAQKLPWDVLVLFGGGLSLAAAISATGLARWIGTELAAIASWPIWLIMLTVVAVIAVLSEVASNTATAAAFLPVIGSLAVGLGEDPLTLAVPTALAASIGFMLPVATPPNAIAYASGYITVPQMVRAGAWLDLICVVVILAVCYALMGAVFGV